MEVLLSEFNLRSCRNLLLLFSDGPDVIIRDDIEFWLGDDGVVDNDENGDDVNDLTVPIGRGKFALVL